ncbi:uncharacterized protein LOC116346252 [Contarinia nasturtii]|uniref:uncharacterized protein LOC116346252 n=1 Tax=Contarinia nasturtii TaxID=265458 RepID=UPI0012D3E1D8|nr:uncharacterized protein LOC116346252 [Contarinia nasturtii]
MTFSSFSPPILYRIGHEKSRIIGGEEADPGEFPWMAALAYIRSNKVVYDCGGTIISEYFVMTAGHCVRPDYKPIFARLGEIAKNDDDRTQAVIYQIQDHYRHLNYSAATKQNDIALVKVSKAIEFTSKIAPCLQMDIGDGNTADSLIVTRWGTTDSRRTNKSNVLLKAQLKSMSFSECSQTLINKNILQNGVSEGQYCAFDPAGRHDSCQGDGPLRYFPDGDSYIATIVGIVSFGQGCGLEMPGVYTRVAHYFDWIESIVWPLNGQHSNQTGLPLMLISLLFTLCGKNRISFYFIKNDVINCVHSILCCHDDKWHSSHSTKESRKRRNMASLSQRCSNWRCTKNRRINKKQSGRYERIVQIFIEKGADVNIINKIGTAPIIAAAQEGHGRVVELLLKNGANVNSQNQFGSTPFAKGANVNITNKDGWTPISAAAEKGHVQIVQLLLMNGANVNLQSSNGATPLYSATWHGRENSVAVLARNGADVNIQKNGGWSPLQAAIEQGFEKIVEILMRYGADVKLKNNNNDTSMAIAIRKGNAKIIEILKTVRRIRPAETACQTHSTDRIINGELAGDNEFPWMAALGYLNSNYTVTFDCGGTIISNYFILTAAHCVKVRRPVVIRLGKVSLTNADGEEIRAQNRDIKDIIPHPGHSRLTKVNDIALIRVRHEIIFSEYIRPACLQIDLRDEPPHVKLTVTGWGSTSTERLMRSNRLLKTELISMPLSRCNLTLINWFRLSNDASLRNGLNGGQYCAYDPAGRNDSCQGDSGGPLQYYQPNRTATAVVVGIVSFGSGCASSLPAVYTRVAYYLDWIEQIVWPNV